MTVCHIIPLPNPRSRRSDSCENGRFQSRISSAGMHVAKRLIMIFQDDI